MSPGVPQFPNWDALLLVSSQVCQFVIAAHGRLQNDDLQQCVLHSRDLVMQEMWTQQWSQRCLLSLTWAHRCDGSWSCESHGRWPGRLVWRVSRSERRWVIWQQCCGHRTGGWDHLSLYFHWHRPWHPDKGFSSQDPAHCPLLPSGMSSHDILQLAALQIWRHQCQKIIYLKRPFCRSSILYTLSLAWESTYLMDVQLSLMPSHFPDKLPKKDAQWFSCTCSATFNWWFEVPDGEMHEMLRKCEYVSAAGIWGLGLGYYIYQSQLLKAEVLPVPHLLCSGKEKIPTSTYACDSLPMQAVTLGSWDALWCLEWLNLCSSYTHVQTSCWLACTNICEQPCPCVMDGLV